MVKSIELNQVKDTIFPDRTIADVNLDGDKIMVGFLDEEGEEYYPIEDLSPNQLYALVRALVQTCPEE